MRVHYPSTGERRAAFRAWPSVPEMFLLHVPDKGILAKLFPTSTPQTFNPLSLTDSVNGVQMSRNVVSENWCVARHPTGDPATAVLP